MEAHLDESDSTHSLADGLGDTGDHSNWGPPGPDGGPIQMPVPPPAPARPFTAEHVPCLRDCRYYMHTVTHFDAGNPAGTFREGYEPKQHHHACGALRGVYLELSGDSPVYDCNRWDPMTGQELHQIANRREGYYTENPDHRPKEKDHDATAPRNGSPNDPG